METSQFRVNSRRGLIWQACFWMCDEWYHGTKDTDVKEGIARLRLPSCFYIYNSNKYGLLLLLLRNGAYVFTFDTCINYLQIYKPKT